MIATIKDVKMRERIGAPFVHLLGKRKYATGQRSAANALGASWECLK
jgi:hypothetical protein